MTNSVIREDAVSISKWFFLSKMWGSLVNFSSAKSFVPTLLGRNLIIWSWLDKNPPRKSPRFFLPHFYVCVCETGLYHLPRIYHVMINHHHRVHTKPGPVMSHSPLPMAASDRFCWNSHRVPEAYTGSTCSSIRHLTESSAFHHGKPGWCPHSLLPVFRTLNVNQIRLSPKKSIPEMEMQVEKKKTFDFHWIVSLSLCTTTSADWRLAGGFQLDV